MGGTEVEQSHPIRDRFTGAISRAGEIARGVFTYIPHALEFRNITEEGRLNQVVDTMLLEGQIWSDRFQQELERLGQIEYPTIEDQDNLQRIIDMKPGSDGESIALRKRMFSSPDHEAGTDVTGLMEQWKQKGPTENT